MSYVQTLHTPRHSGAALQPLATVFAFVSLLLTGAIFGFFFAWICSTIWGLDTLDPQLAITAMQAMNASVRNAVFAPAFFGPTPVLILAGALLWAAGSRPSGMYFLAAAGIYFGGAFLLTLSVNVPMNEALAQVTPPANRAEAQAIWQDYAATWQVYNILRTLASGAALLCVGIGFLQMSRA